MGVDASWIAGYVAGALGGAVASYVTGEAWWRFEEWWALRQARPRIEARLWALRELG